MKIHNNLMLKTSHSIFALQKIKNMCISRYYEPYVKLLVFEYGHITQRLGARAGSNTSQKEINLTLLHLLLRGDILRNSVRLSRNQIYLIKNLLITGKLKALVV